MRKLPFIRHSIHGAFLKHSANLIAIGGYEAYGRYWRLIELIAATLKYDVKAQEIPLLAVALNTTPEALTTLLEQCCKAGFSEAIEGGWEFPRLKHTILQFHAWRDSVKAEKAAKAALQVKKTIKPVKNVMKNGVYIRRKATVQQVRR